MTLAERTCSTLVGLMLCVATTSALAAPTATITSRMVGVDGRVTTITQEVDPVVFGDVLAAPDPRVQEFDPPGAPARPSPPESPGTPPETTRVDYHQERNGWTRDTSWERDVPIRDGRPDPGPWRLTEDRLKYVGCTKIPASCSPF